MKASLLVIASLLLLPACSAERQPVPSSVAAPTNAPIRDTEAVYCIRHVNDQWVVFTLSRTVRNKAGALIRVASLCNTPRPDGSDFVASVSEPEVERNYPVRHGVAGRVTTVQPRDGLTWADVQSESDLELQVQ